ncbi:hypothetical protein [Flexithrix dorotheae]|uniref:hypothetical protein n=1 Tax=Flexithrix dorotheae TaxID=70993 RepID=UPI00036C3DCA|nr:hypothetical protein [Flexithrix dorotheae]
MNYPGLICLLFVILSHLVTAQSTKTPTRRLFAKDDPLKISIEMDVKELLKTKYKDEYHPAKFTLYLHEDSIIEKTIKVKTRGNSRKSICYYPPLKLNFKHVDFGSASMNTLKKLKIVTVCKEADTYEQYILKEYLVYKMYNLLTDYSFNVRLLDVTQKDSQGKKDPLRRYGFVIEEIDQLAERNNALEIETPKIHPDQTNKEIANLLAVFQFMIGNTDWSIPGLHNIKLIKSKNPTEFAPIAIPYDFDYSGFVNTTYAIPDPALGIENVRVRDFRGFCRTLEEFQKTMIPFLENKEEIFNLVNEFEPLSERNKKECVAYLQEFYKIIENENLIKYNFVNNCRTN